MTMKAGFIGLGHMGSRMSKNVLRTAGSLLVSDISEAAKNELKEAGADIAEDNAQVARECDVIFLSLPAPKHVRAVVAGPDGLIENGKAGSYIIDLSTIDAGTSVEMSKIAAEKGIIYIDLPVSGGVAGAEKGTLSLMAGAKEEEMTKIMPLVNAIGKATFIGKRGGGSSMKLINNYMAFTHLVADSEAVIMSEKLGIDLDTFFTVVSASSGGDTALHHKRAKIESGDFSANFAVDLVVKDLDLAAQTCKDYKIPNYSLNQAIQFYRMAQSRGMGQMDTISILGMLRDIESADGQA